MSFRFSSLTLKSYLYVFSILSLTLKSFSLSFPFSHSPWSPSVCLFHSLTHPQVLLYVFSILSPTLKSFCMSFPSSSPAIEGVAEWYPGSAVAVGEGRRVSRSICESEIIKQTLLLCAFNFCTINSRCFLDEIQRFCTFIIIAPYWSFNFDEI